LKFDDGSAYFVVTIVIVTTNFKHMFAIEEEKERFREGGFVVEVRFYFAFVFTLNSKQDMSSLGQLPKEF